MNRSSSLVVSAALSVLAAACGGSVARDVTSDPPSQAPPTTVGGDPGAVGAPGQVGTAPGRDPATPAATAEGTCVTLVGAGSKLSIATVDLATGKIDQGPPIVDARVEGVGPTSLGVVGDEVVFCASHSDGSGSGTIVRASRTDGSTKVISRSCDAVTATAEGVWVLAMYEQTLTRYAGLDDLAAGTPAETRKAPFASRIGPSTDGLLSAWHSTDEIDRVRPDGVAPVKLEGFDGWVFGVSALPNGHLVVASPRAGGLAGLVLFDGTTGKNHGVVVKAPAESMEGFNGLSCMPRGP